MHPPSRAFSFSLCLLALAAVSAAGWAQPACPTLSACPWQAGRQALPERETAGSPRPSTPEVRSPVIVNSCDAGGCLDPDGSRYNGSGAGKDGGVYLDSQGRRCVRSGEWLQCG